MKSACQSERERIDFLKEKALWVRRETLRIHGRAPETRIASSLSDVEIFVALYYGGLLKYDAENLRWSERDRFIVSKGHGAISLYPILADCGFFDSEELKRVCRKNSFLGGIPDIIIPGFETTNGSLGHGLGVTSGMALAMKRKQIDSTLFVLLGDGELYEGAVWEAVMFAAEQRLDNLVAIVDSNKISMLDYCSEIIDLSPLEKKFEAFNWLVSSVDGHDMEALYTALEELKGERGRGPKVLIANTIKGKGVPRLEGDPLCHIRSLTEDEVVRAIEELQ